ncbi:PQQ-binding-like beta-propeller repeat protein [Catellatospora sp. KI3]|uniref:outer membrane protein assembly factor BamB family protein n=1 Tax=Catellatospora sp. KI3 TaxID=3041620 RepID=UPI0024832C7C|nr:PQQ-binding-like beta-propeller repeat protein [Catellatospora sp. KI3]MDI1464957.1 PQQ-binding-like beta-propeller repeat protein [Catellatospora sp. KI3]
MTAEIDLGSGWSHPHDPQAGPVRWSGGFAGRLRPAAFVLAGLLTLMCAEAAGPVRPVVGLASMATVPTADEAMVVTDGLLLVAERGALAAFDLRDGAPRWSAVREIRADQITLEVPPGSGVVLLHEGDLAQDTQQTTAFEIATGRQVWHRDAWVVTAAQVGYDRMLLVAGVPTAVQREVIDLATGAVRWTVPETAVRGVSDDPDPLCWSADEYGQVRAYRLADGSPVADGHIAALRDVPPNLIIERGLLTPVRFNWETGESRYDVLSYDTATFAAVPTTPELIDAVPCGRLRCTTRQAVESFVVQVRDPDSGVLRYELRPGRLLRETPVGFLVLAPGVTRFGLRAESLIDPDTGHTVRVLAPGWEAAAADTSGTVLREAADRVQIGRLESDGTVRVLAELPPRVRRCQYLSGLLACHDADDRIALWRLTG